MRTYPEKRSSTLPVLLLTIFIGALALSACGDTSTATPVPAPTARPTTPATTAASTSGKIAVVLSGPKEDASWNSLGYEAVIEMRNTLGVKVDYAENVTTDKEAEVFKDFAEKGYGLIIAHGAEFEGTVLKVAPSYPKTWFLVYNGDISGPNYASMRFKGEEASYLAGIVAARAVKGTRFGLVMGPKVPGEIAIEEGFKQGLKATSNQALTTTINLDSWDDENAGRNAANQLFDQGVDVILYTINPLSQPVLQVAEARGKKAINLSYDLQSLSPNNILTSIVISVPASFMVPARLWTENKLEGKIYRLGLKEGAISITSPGNKISSEDMLMVEQARGDIITGRLKVKDTP
ncbi:MAG TPA: BMP family protein [Chloroflexia bacterium]|nr:BMP family protein [Chloroflexia bacterium]